MKRILILFVMVMFGFTHLTGCGSKSENKLTELNFLITWDVYSGRGEAIGRIVQQFNSEHEYIHVNMISGNENRDDILNQLNSQSVDVYAMPYRFLKDEDIDPFLLELSNEIKEEWDFYYDTLVEMTGNDGMKYGVPWIGHSMALVYNKGIVQEAGLNPQEWFSYIDLLEGCQAVVEKTDAKGLGLVGANHHDITWMVNQFIYTFGGRLMDEDDETILINSQASIDALEFYKNDLGAYAQDGWENDTGVEVLEAFGNGEIAFEIQGPWAISDIWKRGYPFETGVLPLDRLGMYSEVGPTMLSISKASVYPEEALTFIKYMIEVNQQEQIMDGEYDPKYEAYYPFRVPLRKDMQTSEFFEKYPDFLGFIEGFKRPSINTPCDKWAAIQEEQYPMLLHEIMTNARTIESALEEVGQ